MYKENVLLNQTVLVCAKVFLFYNAVKPCEICATKAKYLNERITTYRPIRYYVIQVPPFNIACTHSCPATRNQNNIIQQGRIRRRGIFFRTWLEVS